MSGDQDWARLDDLLDGALEQPPERRREWLAEARPGPSPGNRLQIALVGTRSNPLTIAVGYEAGQFALGWGVNPTITHADLGYTDTEGTIAIGCRACHENAFPRGVSIGFEASVSCFAACRGEVTRLRFPPGSALQLILALRPSPRSHTAGALLHISIRMAERVWP